MARGAAEELRADGRYVVVAHGGADGTVVWCDNDGSHQPWMWVGMDPAPTRTRVYLYCCHAGPALTRALKHCESFGHSSRVPAPVEGAEAVVVPFLDRVDELMNGDDFDAAAWRRELSSFVAEQLELERQEPTSVLGKVHWTSLLISLRPKREPEV